MSTTAWRAVPGWDKYEVSEDGRVRSLHWGEPRARKLVSGGPYPMVMLKQDGRLQNFEVHRLVALAFLGERPDGLEVAHEDGDGYNNFASNLRWKTPAQNSDDKVRHGTVVRGRKHWNVRLSVDQVLNIRRRVHAGDKRTDIAKDAGISRTYLFDIINGKRWGWLVD